MINRPYENIILSFSFTYGDNSTALKPICWVRFSFWSSRNPKLVQLASEVLLLYVRYLPWKLISFQIVNSSLMCHLLYETQVHLTTVLGSLRLMGSRWVFYRSFISSSAVRVKCVERLSPIRIFGPLSFVKWGSTTSLTFRPTRLAATIFPDW